MSYRSPPPGDNPNPKRRKIANACEPCRVRKARCDGMKPTCGACSTRGQQCLYKAVVTDVERTNQYVETLVNKISQLEQEVITLRSSNQGPPRGSDGTAQGEGKPAPTRGIIGSGVSSVDAMGGNAGPEISSAPNDKFHYGSSSALSFTRQMYSAILRKDAMPSSSAEAAIPPTVRLNSGTTLTSKMCDVEPENFSLLPRQLSDQLMHIYWTRVHVLYPFIHRKSFDRSYDDLWRSPAARKTRDQRPGVGLGGSEACGPSSLVFHCALNAMFALGLQFCDSFTEVEKERLATTCMNKSKNLLKLDLFDDGDMSLVQTLLILTQYFQSTSSPNKCWTSMGVACRLAQGLGLHLEEARDTQQFDPIERDIRRRVWHGCVTLDITVSMTLGRPAMLIGNAGRSLPEAVDEADWTLASPDDPESRTSIIAFFTESIKLYRTVGRILLNVYKLNDQQNDKPDTSDGCNISFDMLIELDGELSEFARCLPKNLCWTETASPSNLLSSQCHVLHVRFLHSRILLYRPAFFQYCRHNSLAGPSGSRTPNQDLSPTTTVATPFAFHCAVVCVKTAMSLIAAVRQYSSTEATGAWWYNMFYTRIAAMVALLAGICPMIYDAIGGSEAWDAVWTDCKFILENNLPTCVPVTTCLTSLEALRRHVVRHRTMAGADSTPEAHTDTAAEAANILHNLNQTTDSLRHGDHDALDHSAFDTLFDPVDFMEAGLLSENNFPFLMPGLG